MRKHGLLIPTTLLAAACVARQPPTPPAAPFPLAEKWRLELGTAEGDALLGPLVTDGERVFVATRAGLVRAFDVATGAPAWEIGIEPAGALAAQPGRVVAKHEDGAVTLLDPATGHTVWSTKTAAAGELPATLADDGIVAAGRALTRLDAQSGEKSWTTRGVGAFTSLPLVTGTRIVSGTHAGLVRCFLRTTGEPVWEFDLGQALAAPLVADGDNHVLLGTADGWILCLSLSRGKPVWRWRTGARTAHAGVVVGHRYCVASYDAVLHALETSNGHLAWRSALPSRPLGAPVVHGDLIFLLCYGEKENSSTLVAIDGSTGRRAGAFELPGEALAAPLLVQEHFIVPLRAGAVVSLAFAAPEERKKPGAVPPGSAPHGRPKKPGARSPR